MIDPDAANRPGTLAACLLLMIVLTGCGGMIPRGDGPIDAQALLEDPGDHDGRHIVVEGYLGSGMEHSGFGPTLETARGSWIWVSTAGAAMQNTPEGFWSGGTTRVERVRIHGTFRAGPDEMGRGFGHMSAYDHKLLADTITFLPRAEPRVP